MKIGKIGFILIILPLAAAIISFPFLPVYIPIHFSDGFVPDSYAHKSFVFLFSIIPFTVYLFIKAKYKM